MEMYVVICLFYLQQNYYVLHFLYLLSLKINQSQRKKIKSMNDRYENWWHEIKNQTVGEYVLINVLLF